MNVDNFTLIEICEHCRKICSFKVNFNTEAKRMKPKAVLKKYEELENEINELSEPFDVDMEQKINFQKKEPLLHV